MPEQFVCDACHERQPVDLWCPEGSSRGASVCVCCCRCVIHWTDDPGGIAVFAGTPLTWRGLHESPWRMRRHT
jgi:hypothetical protein